MLPSHRKTAAAQAATHGRTQDAASVTTPVEIQYPSLDRVTSPTVPTEQAAYYLNRKGQTLRGWACLENGPLRPRRLHGRLAWAVSDIRALVGGAA